jgi:prevent-host-death family protein
MKMAVGTFKAKCLRVTDDVNKFHQKIVITKHGRPVAKIVPCEQKNSGFFGMLRGSVTIKGDIVKSTGEKWEADED